MALSTRVWGAGKRLLIGGALLLTYLLFAAASMRLALKTRDVVVPSLAGKTVNEASGILIESGLNLKVEENQADGRDRACGPGHQSGSAAGRSDASRAKREGVGQRRAPVEHRAGPARRIGAYGAASLQQDGLQLASSAEIRSADYPTGTVVAQNPSPKSSGGRVALLVNRGERAATYVMPDLIGVNGDRAARPAPNARLSRVDGGRPPLPGRAGRDRPPTESAGRLPGGAR